MRIMFVTLAREERPKEIWNTGPKLNQFLKDKGHTVKYMTVPEKISFWYILIYGLTFMFRYLRFKPDLILSTHQLAFFPISYRRIGLIRKPIIYYWYDLDFESMGKMWGVDKIAFFEFYCVRNADKVFTNSRFQQEVAKKFGVECLYFPLGVEPWFNREVKSVKLPGKYKNKVLYIGTISKLKKIPDLIEGMKNVKADLCIIGPRQEKLDIEIPDNVHFLGFKESKEIPGYIKSADIFVVSTDQDGSLKMFEGLRMGKCILAFQGRIGYVLTHLENAFLCKNFAEGINYLLANPKLIKKIEDNNKKIKIPTSDEVFDLQLKEMFGMVKK